MEIAASSRKAKSRRETWTVHHLTDVHDGSPDHAAELFDARVREIAEDPNALWIGGGDYGDLITPGDPRFSPSGISKEYRDTMGRIPDFYLERLTERLAPIASKCIGFGVGNHEATIGKYYHRGVGAELAMRLGIPEMYLGDRGWCVVGFSYGTIRLSFKAYQYHGWSAGRLKGRKALQAERDLGAWEADAFFLGHDHQPYTDIWFTESLHAVRGTWTTKVRPRAVINGGSWTWGQKPPSTEAEKKKWKPSTAPGQSWVEGKNFRPQPPVSPILILHLDFGNGHGSPAGVGMETRMSSPTFYGNAKAA